MKYFEPATIDEAVRLLAEHDEARCLAGGASLVAMMNARLVEPGALISLRRIEALQSIDLAADGTARIGAGVAHRVVAGEDRLEGGHAVVRQAAGQIANAPVRNMGTIGGAVSHADPAADYPPALVAAGADIEIAKAGGRRTVAAEDFFTDWYATALEDGEMVAAVILPPGPEGARGHYDKLVKVEGDMCIASVALVLALEGGVCSHLRLAIGGCGPAPVRVVEAEERLLGGPLDDAAVAEAGAMLAEALDPPDDVRASADYRRLVVPRMMARAVAAAKAECGP